MPHQPLQRLGEAGLAFLRNLGSTLLHPLIALQEQRFGLVAFLLSVQRLAEHRPGIERRPGVGLLLLAEGQSFAKHRLRVDPFVLLKQPQCP